jgi:hypothetical protein
MDRVFTIEQLRPIKDGMTISRDAKMGTATGAMSWKVYPTTVIKKNKKRLGAQALSNRFRLSFAKARLYSAKAV